MRCLNGRRDARVPNATLPLASAVAKSALHAPVAQLDRALPSEGRGHRFESCRVRQPLGFLNFPISKAIDQMVVDHADRLHVGVNHRRSDEAESALLQILAESV